MEKAIEVARKVFDHVAFSITDDSVEVYEIDMIRRINPEIMDAIIEIQKNLQFYNLSCNSFLMCMQQHIKH